MKKMLLVFFLIPTTAKIIAQSSRFDNPYKALLYNVYYDSIVRKTGTLVPEPGEIKKSTKEDIIHLTVAMKEDNQTNKTIEEEFHTKVVFASLNKLQSMGLSSLAKEKIIDTSRKIYDNPNVNVLGTLIISGVYMPMNKSRTLGDVLFFKIITIGGRHRIAHLGQFVELVRLRKRYGKWKVDKQIITDRS
ncbi:MAG: hypothetical protein HYU71_00820 [Bacteroidetes bacterium]|nr:hypothetical protein [Bacteroidota bacterium]